MEVVLTVSTITTSGVVLLLATVSGVVLLLAIVLDAWGRIKEVHGGECPDEDCGGEKE